MPLTLIVADCLPPVGFAAPAATPAIDTLLHRAVVARGAGSALEDAVLAAFGLDAHAPIAALTHLVDVAHATEARADDGIAWLRADPVHLAVRRDSVQLIDSHILRPTATEMAHIAEKLNRHFAADGIAVDFPDPARGYLRVSSDDVPATEPLWRVTGTNVFGRLPRDGTRTRWRAVGNDMQMLLHDHPVNAAREAMGLPTINGLWLWGGGALKDVSLPQAFDTVAARLALARGLARAAGNACRPEWETFGALEAGGGAAERVMAVVHGSARACRAGDPAAWADAVAAVERDWIVPAVAAFDAGRLDALTIVLANETATLTLHMQPTSWWRTCWARVVRVAPTPGLARYG